jgi:hypothetical protein
MRMARRSLTDVEVPDESIPGGDVSPATDAVDIAPGASGEVTVDQTHDAVIEAAEHARTFLIDLEGELNNDRGRQTLTGAMLVARAIMFAGFTIARAIRESSKATS